MKQLVQHLRTGAAEVIDVPPPAAQPGRVRIAVAHSLVSAGTERMVVEFAARNVLEKARARPDLVRQTIDKARRDGFLTTVDAVRGRLDQPMALGYAVAGTVIDAPETDAFSPGDRVAAAGSGFAVHAETVSVPINLVVPLPDGVSTEEGCFATLGAIALHGIRLADVTLGSRVAVVGLGLLGQLAVQLLKAMGCRVAAHDLRSDRAKLAATLGADSSTDLPDAFASACMEVSDGHGVDAVIITADTPNDGPVELAGSVARDRGVVVAVGAVGTRVPRKTYYQKELDFRISRSYGPGRYDSNYEERGLDYPYAYVRWTENRNLRAFVEAVASGQVRIGPLISHRFAIDDAADAYRVLIDSTGDRPPLGVVIHYASDRGSGEAAAAASAAPLSFVPETVGPTPAIVRIGLLGAGLFARSVLVPAMKAAAGEGLVLDTVCAASGLSAEHARRRFGFRMATTDEAGLIASAAISTVVIATRHQLHARQVVAALDAGRHVFVEKPLCLTREEFSVVECAVARASGQAVPAQLMVGFNRRFAPFSVALRGFVRETGEPLMLHYRVNAGFLPPEHWLHDPGQGGGRLLGECIHFIDYAIWCCGVPVAVTARALPDVGRYRRDNLAMTISFEDGSIAQILYCANGDRGLGKERIEAHAGGRSAVIDDFRRLELHGARGRRVRRAYLRQDKGHTGEWVAFTRAIRRGGGSPTPFNEVRAGMVVAFAAQDSLADGQPRMLGCTGDV